jgi:hypothetical protein
MSSGGQYTVGPGDPKGRLRAREVEAILVLFERYAEERK